MLAPAIRRELVLGGARPFSPLALPGLALLAEADLITGLVNADPVATWADVSGLGHDLTQGTGGLQPTYRTGVMPSGKPIVRFSASALVSAVFTLAQPIHLFMLAKRVAHSGHMIDGLSANNTMAAFANTGTLTQMYAGSGGPQQTPGTTAFHVHSCLYNGASSEYYLDGANLQTGNPGAGNPGGVTLGNRKDLTNAGATDFGAVIIYNRALTTDERQRVERYLGAWGGIAGA